jgi:hypothetical protein
VYVLQIALSRNETLSFNGSEGITIFFAKKHSVQLRNLHESVPRHILLPCHVSLPYTAITKRHNIFQRTPHYEKGNRKFVSRSKSKLKLPTFRSEGCRRGKWQHTMKTQQCAPPPPGVQMSGFHIELLKFGLCLLFPKIPTLHSGFHKI